MIETSTRSDAKPNLKVFKCVINCKLSHCRNILLFPKRKLHNVIILYNAEGLSLRLSLKYFHINMWHAPNCLFSSPEPKARVSFCHSAPSVVRPSVRRPSSVNFHIFDFFSRTASWILMKLGMHEVLMVPYKCCCFSARSPQGRIQGGAKIGHGGSPSSRNFLRLEGYSDKLNA